MLFDWDPVKHSRNLRERGFGFDLAALIFDGEVLLRDDTRRNYGERRIRAIGEAEGTVFAVVFTDRADVRRMISARLANREERRLWLQRP